MLQNIVVWSVVGLSVLLAVIYVIRLFAVKPKDKDCTCGCGDESRSCKPPEDPKGK